MTRARGKPLSSAILYAAIVAIWACVLVPRWLRRPHEQSPDQDTSFEHYDSGQAEAVDAGEFAGTGEPAGGGPYAPDLATQGEYGAVAYGNPVSFEDPAVPDGAEGPVEATYSVTATYSAEVTYSASTEASAGEDAPDAYYEAPAYGGGVPHHSHVPHGAPAHGGDVPHHGHVTHDGPADGWQQPYVPVPAPGPSPHVVQARRRTLTMVLLITVAVMGSAFIGLTPWWTAVPPFVMLGAYLLLLREAARADAEHAHSWAEAQALAVQAARAPSWPASAPARPTRSARRSQRPRSSPSPRWPAGPKTSSTTSTPTPKSAPSATDQAPGVRSGAPVAFRPGRTRSAAAVERTGPRVCYADWRSWGCSAVR